MATNTNSRRLRGILVLAAVATLALVINGKQMAGWATGADAEATGCSEDVYLEDGARGRARSRGPADDVDCDTPPYLPDELELNGNEKECPVFINPSGTYIGGGVVGPSRTFTTTCTEIDTTCSKKCKAFPGLECECGGSKHATTSTTVTFGITGLFASSNAGLTVSTTHDCVANECELRKVFGCAHIRTTSFSCTRTIVPPGTTRTFNQTITRYNEGASRDEKADDYTCSPPAQPPPEFCCPSEGGEAINHQQARQADDSFGSQSGPTEEGGLTTYEISFSGSGVLDSLNEYELCAFQDTLLDELGPDDVGAILLSDDDEEMMLTYLDDKLPLDCPD